LFLADGDQALAAEPGFHGNPPQGGGGAAIAGRRRSDHYSEAVEQQPENGVALAEVPTQVLRGKRDESAAVFASCPNAIGE
jgi:hypothetical protein